tara:strand:- start:5954 stop:6391 length:438 start_codon:yes stop_codon:yes gene_type:complete
MPDNKKAKRAGKKAIRKIKRGKDIQSQSSKDTMAKVVGRTQDPVRSGSAGSGSVKKTTTQQKIQGKTQSLLSTRAKKKVIAINKASYSKGGKVKEPVKNKVKRKISQIKNRKVEKQYKRTHNTNLQDKGNPKDRGYSKGGFIQHD